MENKKHTKRALFGSVIVLILCCAMLIGTTFAWFTDTASSSGNKIQAGTLQIDLEVLEKDTGKWTSVANMTDPIFSYDKWEPGYTEVKILQVVNEGSLALKWKAMLVAEAELTELADVIDVYVKEGVTTYPDNRTDIDSWTKVGTLTEFVNSMEETTTGNIVAGDGNRETLGIAFKMQETAGNQYQGMNLGGAFDICIVATQDTVEKDSFDDQYDVNADFAIEVTTVDELKAALNEGRNIVLADNLQLGGAALQLMDTSVGTTAQSVFSLIGDKNVTIDLNGKTITVDTDGGTNVWTVFYAGGGANLTVSGGRIEYNSKGRSGGTSAFTTFGSESVITLKDVEVEQIDEGGVTQMIYAHGAPQDLGKIYIEGGTYIQKQPTSATNPFYEQGGFNTNIIVSGGTYKVYHDVDLTQYMTLADGYKLELIKTDADGADWYTVVAE